MPATWLLAVVSPSWRSEIGTKATSDFSGSSRPSFRYERSAVLHSQRTTSLIDAPTDLPIDLTSGSGSETAAKARWLVIEWLNGVAGASLKRVGAFSALRAARSSSVSLRRAAIASCAALYAVATTLGSNLTLCTICWIWLVSAAASNSATPSW